MFNIYLKTLRDEDMLERQDFKPGSWLVATDPNHQELDEIALKFGLDPGHLKDAIDPHEVPRYEQEKSDLYFFSRVPVEKDGTIITEPVLIILRQDGVMTVSSGNFNFKNLVQKMSSTHTTTQKIKLFVILVGIINNSYNSMLNKLNKEINTHISNIEQISNKNIIKLIEYERILNDFLNVTVRNNTMLNMLLTGKTLHMFDADHDLVEDLFLATGQMIELTKSSLSNVKNLRDAYSTIMTNNLNRVIKFFTSLTIILTIPTIISSFYGMNIKLPIAEHSLAFGLISALTILICLGLAAFFQKKDWL